MPSQIREGATLPNKIVNQKVVAGPQDSIEDGRKCQSVVSIRLRMSNSIDLNDSAFQDQIVFLSQLACKDSGYGIHSRRFKRMYSEESGPPCPNHVIDRSGRDI